MQEISVEELARWRADQEPFVLLDIREPSEIAAASLPGALQIPMREIPARIGELNPGDRIAVLCHVGGRSERVAEFLATRGYANVYNVEGGIDAYSLRVDPAIPRY